MAIWCSVAAGELQTFRERRSNDRANSRRQISRFPKGSRFFRCSSACTRPRPARRAQRRAGHGALFISRPCSLAIRRIRGKKGKERENEEEQKEGKGNTSTLVPQRQITSTSPYTNFAHTGCSSRKLDRRGLRSRPDAENMESASPFPPTGKIREDIFESFNAPVRTVRFGNCLGLLYSCGGVFLEHHGCVFGHDTARFLRCVFN